MRRRIPSALLLASGIAACLSGTAWAAPLAAPLSVVEPADGARLEAGALATLRWESTERLPDGPAEEWEAFLSLDGGRTFTLRITPHLDAALRTIAWQVPDTPSPDVRLLLRLGDERAEREILVPARLRIVPSRRARALPDLPSGLVRRGSGEPARAGDAGVVAWIDGNRRGRGWSTARQAPATEGLGEDSAPRLRNGATVQSCDGPASPPALAAPASTDTAPTPGRLAAAPPRPQPRSRDILGLTLRRNE